jgi:TonB-linked SusC/RagA family outer membrane protein
MNLKLLAFPAPQKAFLLLLLFLFLAGGVFAQVNFTLTGKITDGETPLANVSVQVKGTGSGTKTNDQGMFSISVVKGQVLVFTYVGYETREMVVGNQRDIMLSLTQTEANVLDDVVVVGYGTTKKVNLTGSIATVSSKDLKGRPISNLSSALQGTMPGVTVTVNNGQPGNDQGTINIRGIGTLGNSDAMVLVDGVVSSMNDINPNDVESITVLKDAASASIYGSRAANGVILIVTKSGKKGETVAHYNADIGKQAMTVQPDFIDSWQAATLYNEALVNEGKSPKYTDAEIQKFKDGSDPERYPNTDWYDLFWRGNGLQQNHSLDVSGGGEKMKSYLSVGYFSQNGIVEGSYLKRYNTRFNTEYKINSRIKLTGNIAYSNQEFREPVSNIHGLDFGQLMATLLQTGRVVPYKINGYYGYSDEGNPVAVLEGGSNNLNKMHRLSGVFQADIEIIKDLHVKPMLGYTGNFIRAKSRINDLQYYDVFTGAPTIWEGPNIVASNSSFTDNLTLQTLIEYSKTLGDHAFKVLGGYSSEQNQSDYLFGSRRGYLNNALDQLDPGPLAGMQNAGNASEYALESAFGRINYSFKDRYLVEGNIRYDGSSRFAPGNRWATFPSVSAGWRISEESFFEPLRHIFSELKIRGSWGMLGNQNIGTYPYQATISTGYNYIFGGQIADGIAPGKGVNTNIKWESTTTKGIGLDAVLLNGMVTFTGDYFIRNTSDILLSLPVASTFGLSAPVINAGSVQNKGVELSAGYHFRKRDFSFDANANFSVIKNEVTDLAGTGPFPNGSTIQGVGLPINSLYGWVADGLFQSQDDIDKHADQSGMGGPVAPGDIKYKDLNNDKVIDGNDRHYLGTYFPKVTYGLSLSARYKGFDAVLFLQGAGNVKSYVSGRILGSLYDKNGDPTSIWLDRWTPDNADASFPRVWNSNSQNDPGLTPSSFWVRSAGYLRLKNVQVGYTVTSRMLSNAGIGLRVFWTAKDLLTFTRFYKWVDPEAPIGGNSYSYPMVRVNSVGVNLTF